MHNLKTKYFTVVFHKVNRVFRLCEPKYPPLCYLIHRMLSAYGSGFGSAGFSQNIAQLLTSGYKRKVPKSWWFRNFYGCGGRTRTYDLRVMSPTSFQLLYSAILGCTLECLDSIPHLFPFVNSYFLLFSVEWRKQGRSTKNAPVIYIFALTVEIRISPATTRSSAAKPSAKLSEYRIWALGGNSSSPSHTRIRILKSPIRLNS